MKNIPEGFFEVCKIDELKEKVGKRFLVNDVDVALFKVNGKIYALENMCPHQHSPIIYDGFIEEDRVVCPAHGWEFNLEDGKLGEGRRGLITYEVIIEDGRIFVKAQEKSLKW